MKHLPNSERFDVVRSTTVRTLTSLMDTMSGRTMRMALAMALTIALPIGLVAASVSSATPASSDATIGFAADNDRAMHKMMAAMMVASTNDVDRDFAMTMIPHHQGAIDMAMAQLRYGKNESLRRIAQGIVVEQQQEIIAMQEVLTRLPSAGVPVVASGLCTSRPVRSSNQSFPHGDR